MKFLEAKRLKVEGENKMLGGPAEDKTSTGPKGPTISPQARTLAGELGVDLATVKGTGANGAVTVADVRKTYEDREPQD